MNRPFLALVTCSFLLLGGCSLKLSNPVVEWGDSEPVLDVFVGDWKVSQIFGHEPSKATRMTVARNVDGSAKLILCENGQSVEMSATLVTISGLKVLSIQGELPGWNIVAILVDGTGNRLIIKEMDSGRLREDVRQALLRGEVVNLDQDDILIRVTATSASLRQYLEARADIFDRTIAVLERQ